MAGKVLVVSLNPAIDCEWEVERVQWEEKNNILRERRWAGGKGSNVARWLQHLDGSTELLVPLGGATGKELAHYLAAAKVRTRLVPLRQPTRVNIIVTTRSGGQMRFNPLGPVLSRAEWTGVIRQMEAFRGTTIIFSGALPRGVPASAYKTLVARARKLGLEPILDCDGEAFAKAVAAKPALVKPNVHELERWWGKPLRSRTDVARAIAALSDAAGGWVVLSRGGEGAVLWHSNLQAGFSGRPPKVKIRNTVGAGDALLAAVVRRKQMGAPPEEWLRWGVATGTAAATSEGGVLAELATIRKLAGQTQVKPFP